MKEILNKNKLIIILTCMLKIVEVVFELIIPLYIAKIIGIVQSKQDIFRTNKIIGIMFIFYLTAVICSLISNYLSAKIAYNVEEKLRDKVYKKVLCLRKRCLDKYETASINNRIIGDIVQIRIGINMFIRVGLRAPILLIGSIIMSRIINKTAFYIFIAVTMVITLVTLYIIKLTAKKNIDIQNSQDKIYKKILNKIEGLRIIKAFCMEKKEYKDIQNMNNILAKKFISNQKIESILDPSMFFFLNFAIVLIIYIGNNLVKTNEIVSGDIIALVNYLNQALLALSVVVKVIVILTKTIISNKRINEILNEKDEEIYGENEDEQINSIELKNVSFSYDNYKVLNNINLKVSVGEILGIIGTTGSGKSTILKLISNIYDSTKGKILINNLDKKEFSKTFYKKSISVVMQKSKPFSETIIENISLGKTYNKESIQKALRISDSKEFVLSLKKGIYYKLEENGKNISGGQKQRLAVASAVIKNPSLIILDDASSALDLKTEKDMYSAIKKEFKDSIIIIISNRISAIKDANKILVLDNGNEVGYASHEELIKNVEVYKSICKLQKVGE